MKRFVFIVFALIPQVLCGQHFYRLGLLPTINVNSKLSSNWSLNLKLENRHVLEEGVFSETSSPLTYDFERQDFVILASRKLSAEAKLAGGYMLRIIDGNDVHRLIQQISLSQNWRALRIAHRFSSDQTWLADQTFELRLRYRFGFQQPLQGTSVDPGEFYFKGHLEYLARFRSGFLNEIRALPALGLLALNENSFELGLDYRLGSRPDRSFVGHGFWIYFGWFIRLDRTNAS